MSRLYDCLEQAEPALRLACLEAATRALRGAEESGEVVLVDQERLREAKRQAFGFQAPALTRLGGSGPSVDEVAFVTARAWRDRSGAWFVESSDGQVWRQIDDRPIVPKPKAGSAVTVRAGALGAFFMTIEGAKAVRAERSR